MFGTSAIAALNPFGTNSSPVKLNTKACTPTTECRVKNLFTLYAGGAVTCIGARNLWAAGKIVKNGVSETKTDKDPATGVETITTTVRKATKKEVGFPIGRGLFNVTAGLTTMYCAVRR